MTAVIYARYSTDSQREESIEGQIRECVLLVCDNCAMVKKLPELAELMRGAPDGLPYEGGRVHSVLDLEDRELVRQVMDILLRVTPLPKRRK